MVVVGRVGVEGREERGVKRRDEQKKERERNLETGTRIWGGRDNKGKERRGMEGKGGMGEIGEEGRRSESGEKKEKEKKRIFLSVWRKA